METGEHVRTCELFLYPPGRSYESGIIDCPRAEDGQGDGEQDGKRVNRVSARYGGRGRPVAMERLR